jgi:hypothetical protein
MTLKATYWQLLLLYYNLYMIHTFSTNNSSIKNYILFKNFIFFKWSPKMCIKEYWKERPAPRLCIGKNGHFVKCDYYKIVGVQSRNTVECSNITFKVCF